MDLCLLNLSMVTGGSGFDFGGYPLVTAFHIHKLLLTIMVVSDGVKQKKSGGSCKSALFEILFC